MAISNSERVAFKNAIRNLRFNQSDWSGFMQFLDTHLNDLLKKLGEGAPDKLVEAWGKYRGVLEFKTILESYYEEKN